MKTRVDSADLNPVLLNCTHSPLMNISGKMSVRQVYDYEFEFFVRSGGGIIIDGKYTPFSAGDINIRKPGQLVQGVGPYEVYILCVDFFGNTEKAGGPFFGSPARAQPLIDNPLLEGLANRIPASFSSRLQHYFEALVRYHALKTDFAVFRTKSILSGLLSELFRFGNIRHTAPGVAGAVQRAVNFFNRNYMTPINIGHVIDGSNYGRAQFHKLFQEYANCTPLQYITNLRMERARQLLLLTGMPIAEVAFDCGYEDNSYFIRLFTKKTGTTPGAFRKNAYKSMA